MTIYILLYSLFCLVCLATYITASVSEQDDVTVSVFLLFIFMAVTPVFNIGMLCAAVPVVCQNNQTIRRFMNYKLF